MKKIYFVIAIISALSLFNATAAFSADTLPFYAASGVKPNVLIVLDRSGSMEWDLAGNSSGITACPTLGSGLTTGNYSRICIARHVLFDLLDADNDQTVEATEDEITLGVRLGYGEYISSTVTIPYDGDDIGTSYDIIFPDATRSNTGGGTPLADSLIAARTYLTSSSITGETCYAAGCRKSYVIVITDGADTRTCETGESVANRRATVYAAKALSDDDIPVFVVGFGGSLPADLQNTLNWAAYYGYGGDDPNSLEAHGGGGAYTKTGPLFVK